VGKTTVVYVTFLRDIACQKLLNSANVSRSYSQNKTGTVFLRHGAKPAEKENEKKNIRCCKLYSDCLVLYRSLRMKWLSGSWSSTVELCSRQPISFIDRICSTRCA